jgi:hypothetical protein
LKLNNNESAVIQTKSASPKKVPSAKKTLKSQLQTTVNIYAAGIQR